MRPKTVLVGIACALLFLSLAAAPVMAECYGSSCGAMAEMSGGGWGDSVWDVGIHASCYGWENYWNGYRWATPTAGYYGYYDYYPYDYYSPTVYVQPYPDTVYGGRCESQSCTNVVVVEQEKQQQPAKEISQGSTQSPTTRCGDGWCSGSETQHSCPADCGPLPYCGDGVCSNGETPQSCRYDCEEPEPETYCGDGRCNGAETKYSCPNDCGHPAYCGDGTCNGAETRQSCPEDCGLAPYCGDGKCDLDESRYNCAKDCGLPPYCGDGKCDNDESPYSCSLDCGAAKCTNPAGEEGDKTCDGKQQLVCRDGNWDFYKSVQCCDSGDCPIGYVCNNNHCDLRTFCGDGRCLDRESPYNCPQDCAVKIAPPIVCPQPPCQQQPRDYCGDGVCNGDETCASCSQDCGACYTCGDGVCNTQTENQQNCPQDCGEPARHQIGLRITDECQEIEQGMEGSFTLLVENRGNVPETLSLTASGPLAPWVGQPATVTVLDGASESWGLVVEVPEDMSPGLYDINVAASNNDVQDAIVLHVDVKLPPLENGIEVGNETGGGNLTESGPTGAFLAGELIIPDWAFVLAILAVIALLFIFLISRTNGTSVKHSRLHVISERVREPTLTADGGVEIGCR